MVRDMHAGDADAAFLYDAFKQGRVAHLCIHNEYNVIHYDTRPDTDDRRIVREFCDGLGAYTRRLSPYALTVRAQFDINTTNGLREKIAAHRGLPFTPYYPKTFLSYDPKALRVDPSVSDDDLVHPVYIDLVDPDFDDYVVVGQEGDVLYGDPGQAVKDLLYANKCDVIIGTGLYVHACVKATLQHAVDDGFIVYAVTDRILNHPWSERERENGTHAHYMAGYDPRIRRIGGADVLKLAGGA